VERRGKALLFGGQLGAAPGLARRFAGEPAFGRWLQEREAAGTSDARALLLDEPCPAAADRFGAARLMVLFNSAAAAVCADRLGTPPAVAGYSLGFYAAAEAAGVAPVEVFLEWVGRVNAADASLFPPGAYATGLCVGLTREELESRLAGAGLGSLAVSGVNNRTQLLFAGPAGQVRAAAELLAPTALDVRTLPFDVPLHSRHLVPAAAEVAPWWDTVPLGDPTLPLLSPVDGAVLPSGECFRAAMLSSLTAPTDWAAVVEGLKGRVPPEALDLSPGGDLGRMSRWGWRELVVKPLSSIIS